MSTEQGEGKVIGVERVKVLIEQCLAHYMSQKEMMDILYEKENIAPSLTKTVLQHLIEQNQKFFKNYYFMLAVKHQSMNHIYYPYEVDTMMMNHKFNSPATATKLQIDQPGILGLQLQATPIITPALRSAPPATDNQLSGSG